MADIFISYARVDRDTARVFADVFAAHDWTVWWDPEIFYGTEYDKVIEGELAKAKCIVVLWSKRSAGSRWVRAEASWGFERQALVPVLIDADADVPLEFAKIHTADLSGWDGDREDPTFKGLVRAMERVIRLPRPAGENGDLSPGGTRPSPLKPWRRMFVRRSLFLAPTLIGVFAAAVAMLIRRPTAFDINLTVSKVAFVSAAGQSWRLLEKTSFTNLYLHGIEKGTLSGESAELLPQPGMVAASEHELGGRTLLSLPVLIASRDANGATVLFRAAPVDTSAGGEVGPLFLATGARAEITVAKFGSPGITLEVRDQPLRVVLFLRGGSDIELLQAKITPAESAPVEAPKMMLHVKTSEKGSIMELLGGEKGVMLSLELSNVSQMPLDLVSDLRVSGMDFAALEETGKVVSSVCGDGTIGFTGVPKKEIAVRQGEYVLLRDPSNFFLRKLVFRPEERALHLEAGGVAGSLRSGPAGNVVERALTWFDWIWHQPRSVQLRVLALWLLSQTLAAYKFLKETGK